MKSMNRTQLLIVILGVTIIASLGLTQPSINPDTRSLNNSASEQPIDTDVIYVIRHADTEKGNNPNLSAEGQVRAENLVSILQDEQLSAVFVTNTARSIQTGTPAALADGISTTIYSPFDATGVAASIASIPGSSATLVVAHSNTVPLVVQALGGPTLEDLEETEFDRLFAIVLSNGKYVRTLQLHYE
jgi:broad specificity phosphatase PhoE